MKPASHAVWVIAVMISLTGCEGCPVNLDFTNEVDPAGGTPAQLVNAGGDTELWLVKWDNPVVGGLFDLPMGQENGFAIRKDNAWEYNKFDLEAVTFTPADQTDDDIFFTWPEFEGVFGADRPFFFWEMHGIKLRPRISNAPQEAVTVVQAVRDDWNASPTSYKNPGLFQLDPAVNLVPIHVVVMHPQPGHLDFPPGWFSFSDANLLFDDFWIGDKTTNTDPSHFPDNVITSWDYRAGCRGQVGCRTVVQAPGGGSPGPVQPDRIFDQCDVQFRLVSYRTCPVPSDLFFRTGCGLFGLANSLTIEANNCGVPADQAVTVIFTGTIGDPTGCFEETFGFYSSNTTDVYIPSIAATGHREVIAHELGHALGLNDLPCGMVGDENLMCQSIFQHNEVLGSGTAGAAAQCETAHTTAGVKQDAWYQ